MKKEIVLRPIDRWVIALLAVLVAASGIYLVGPWYLETTPDGKPGPVYYLTQSLFLLRVLGFSMVLASIGLFWSVTRKAGVIKRRILASSLLATFLLRFYVLIGTMLTLESWRPPGYLSAFYATNVAGAYWIWVRRDEGTS